MLIDRDARPILKKVPGRCAGVMLLGLLAGTAFLDFSRPALAVIAFAPWICFLVLLWGFFEFASIEWEKPRGTRAVGDAGVRGFGTGADLDSMVATYTQVAASTSSSGDSAESMDLNSILDSILWLPDGDSIPAPRAIGSPGTKAQEGARPGRGTGESLRPSGDRDSEEGSRR
jgi:hypothetical protein